VSICIDGLGSGKTILVQYLHKAELSNGGQPGEIEPIEAGSVLDVLPVVFNSPE
jgi:hypothetical protein